MKVTIDVEDSLLLEALKISGAHTKEAAIETALKEYLRKNNLKKILNYRGMNIWEGNLEEMRSPR